MPNKEVNPFADSATLSNVDLERWCRDNSLTYNLVTLEELQKASASREKFNFVFTGEHSSPLNNGYHNHWMFLYGNFLFDSYGYQGEYKLPESIKPVNTYPKRLQQFNSNVCGEYCCAFYHFVKHHTSLDFTNLGQQFCNEFNFSSSQREKNDEIVLEFYRQHAHSTKSNDAPTRKAFDDGDTEMREDEHGQEASHTIPTN